MAESATDDEFAQHHSSAHNYNGKKRRAGEPNHVSGVSALIRKWGPIIVAIPTIGGMIFTVTNLWFQSDAEAADAKNEIMMEQASLSREIGQERTRNNTQDAILNQINSKLDRGEILALKAERRGLINDIESTRNNPAVRERLKQQLEAVEEDLRLKGIQ